MFDRIAEFRCLSEAATYHGMDPGATPAGNSIWMLGLGVVRLAWKLVHSGGSWFVRVAHAGQSQW